MANIKIELGHPIIDGMPLSFRAPCNCNEITGLKVIYHVGEDTFFVVFSFADAHGNNLKGLTNLFAAGAMVRVVLDTANAKAFIQNADTNAYLEGKFAEAMTAAENAQKAANSASNAATKAQNTANAALPKAGGTMTGQLTVNGLFLTPGVDYGDTLPADAPRNKIFFLRVT